MCASHKQPQPHIKVGKDAEEEEVVDYMVVFKKRIIVRHPPKHENAIILGSQTQVSSIV